MSQQQEFERLYLELIKKALNDGVSIREDCQVPKASPYQYKPNPKQIRIYRDIQPAEAWVDGHSSAQRRMDLVIRSGFRLHEVIGVAHELGHSYSSDTTIDELYERARQNQALTRDEKKRIIEEEIGTWVAAENSLRSIGCTNWNEFLAQKADALDSYNKIDESAVIFETSPSEP